MREILFRGKRIDNGEWIYGDLRHWRNGEVGIHDEISKRTVKVYPSTIGQYTGMTGKKIFEGDICRVCLDPEICVGVVEYDERLASFIVKVGETEMLTFLDFWISRKTVGDAVWVEVIGNIHDNPELLEVNADG